MKSISSDANAYFRRWLRISSSPRAVRASGLTLAEGIHLAQSAIAAQMPIDALVLRKGIDTKPLEAVLAQLPQVPAFELSAALYDRIAPVELGAGLLLVLPIPVEPPQQRCASDLVYLDGVQDPGNVGAIIRTAAAAGIGRVMASPGTAALWAPKVLRAAMGAHFRLHLHERVNADALERWLAGTWVAAVAHDAPSLWQQDLGASAVGWVFGAEGSGPSQQAMAACKLRVRIPANSAVESLNVGAAAAVCLFERARRQALPTPRDLPGSPGAR